MKPFDFSRVDIQNPKIYADSISHQESRLYPYYAGYAGSFAEATLRGLGKTKNCLVFDPWNGSGTTTLAAAKLGFNAIGQDLNPVMVLVAKAALLPRSEATSLPPLARTIVENARRRDPAAMLDDPLASWLAPSSAAAIRMLEAEIYKSLVSSNAYAPLTDHATLDDISSLASLFYVALFRATRQLLKDFVPSNPTWVKKPTSPRTRKRPDTSTIDSIFVSEVEQLSNRLIVDVSPSESNTLPTIHLGNAERISLPNGSIDIVVTSPPYCTRIDYAVATSIELAILRASTTDFDSIRRSLMGTSTVPRNVSSPSSTWGETCSKFLQQLYRHPSKASTTYYYKNHLQYFDSLSNSISEIARVVKPQGKVILVVQDSYYKEIHNDVAKITTEMGQEVGLSLALRRDFPSGRTMGGINGRSKKYRADTKATESVLCFART